MAGTVSLKRTRLMRAGASGVQVTGAANQQVHYAIQPYNPQRNHASAFRLVHCFQIMDSSGFIGLLRRGRGLVGSGLLDVVADAGRP